MADNYLEKQYDDYDKRKTAHAVARNKLWQRRLRAYQEKLAQEKKAASAPRATDSEQAAGE